MRTQRETDLEDEIELLSGQLLAFYARVDELEGERDAWKESRDFRVKEHLADKERIAKLEADLQTMYSAENYEQLREMLDDALANSEVAVAVRVGPNSTGITDDMIIERGRE